MPDLTRCPDCGTQLSDEPWTEGLCPACLLELALTESSAEAPGPRRLDELPTLAAATETLAEGQILGRRYRVRSQLGRGGMGEVWRAFDLKLRVDVALKALRVELLEHRRALETLRQEVRVAREVNSPNVCRVFDLLELDGRELVSMEYIDGTTLAEILRSRGPLELGEARDTASQFLAGLEAIHRAGLVHRDVKPENVMITRAGRVVVMDFGIAKGLEVASTGTVSGTPAYMAPEQARGEGVDARADVFSAGVVLAEMVAPGGTPTKADRQAVWRGVQQDPPELADSFWQAVLQRAVAHDRGERHASASVLARALEEITLRVERAEDLAPYPGLASFTEEDAEYFFGRELEVETLWKKLRRPHLLALIGPSGAGKSSFLRAGLIPTMPEGWSGLICSPGGEPFMALARVLADELAGDKKAVRQLLQFEDPEVAVGLVSAWSKRYKHALIIVDQFEELFTLNPAEVQLRFAELLGRLALEADVHVLLSMRDDFLFRCQPLEALSPVFSELTPLGALSGSSLRRALVQPALRCGYRFEDDGLEDEMVAEVGDERGALPMLAFAASRLWERRDRENGLLTREAYEEIGGVGGALAQHAEATLERIGTDRIPLVRELFRNLLTAQGTRAARHRDELLSVFEEGAREAAAEVLDTLIDARLLTSYELPAAEGEERSHHRIEIIHESLLSAWPRLVRWQTQDTEGAQLRDELRQAARMWEQHERSEDLLWTGTAFREFELWHERYPGGLSELEEDFARALVAHAERRTRRRRLAVAAALVLALAVSLVTSTLWRQSEASRALAENETRRAEASKLLALAQLQLETDPTEALAFATVSLELADTLESRLFVLRALTEAPPARVLSLGATDMTSPAFSPKGEWIAVAGFTPEVQVWSKEGQGPIVLPGHVSSPEGPNTALWSGNGYLVTWHFSENLRRVWSIPEGRLVRTIDLGGTAWTIVGAQHLLAASRPDPESDRRIYRLRSWLLAGGEPEELGRFDMTAVGAERWLFVPGDRGWIYTKGDSVHYVPLPLTEGGSDRILGHHGSDIEILSRHRRPGEFWSRDSRGEFRLWDTSGPIPQLARVIPKPAAVPDELARALVPDSMGRLRGSPRRFDSHLPVWDPDALSGAEPLRLRRRSSWYFPGIDFDPSGNWQVASADHDSLTFWPSSRPYPSVVEGYAGFRRPLAFSPDGKWLATGWPGEGPGGEIRLWPLPGTDLRETKRLELPIGAFALAFDPQGRYVFVTGFNGRAFVVPLDGRELRELEGFSSDTLLDSAAVSPSGDRVATGWNFGRGKRELRVWDLEKGGFQALSLPEPPPPPKDGSPAQCIGAEDAQNNGFSSLQFADESTLYAAVPGGVLKWDLDTGLSERVRESAHGGVPILSLDRLSGNALIAETRPDTSCQCLQPSLWDLESGDLRPLEGHQDCVSWQASDVGGGIVVTGHGDGLIRIGRPDRGAPHLLVGHGMAVQSVALSPDGRWIASSGDDDTLRLWPMPDLEQLPLHELPYDELLTKLRSLTNLRAVEDPESSTGWKIEIGRFPGWGEVPSW